MFQAVAGDAPVDAGLRVVVPWHALPLLVWPVCRLAKARPTRLLLSLCQAHEAHEHGIVIVHWHRKMRMPRAIHVYLTRTGAPGGELTDIGGNVLVDAHPDVRVHPPRGGADHARRAFHPIQHGVHPQLSGEMAASD